MNTEIDNIKEFLNNHKKQIIIGLIIATFLITGLFYLNQSYKATSEALKLINKKNIYVDKHNWIIANPDNNTKTGIIIYPGGNIKPESYLPLALQLKNRGYKTIIVSMPFDLAVFNSDEAINVLYEFTEIDNWYLIGHSLGGSMAARIMDQHVFKFDGLVLLASYPPDNTDLSRRSLPILSITASQDKIMNWENYWNAKSLLPDNTKYIEIEGGNHSQFGCYGHQKNDGESKITRQQQLDRTTQAIDQFIIETLRLKE